jgi:hypothetical protein
MVLLEIDAAGLAILEFEGDAPWSVDMDRIALRIETVQGMKVEAGNVHFLGSDGDVETIEPCENALMHLRIDLRTLALGPKFRKGFAFEGSDHKPM